MCVCVCGGGGGGSEGSDPFSGGIFYTRPIKVLGKTVQKNLF